MMIACGSDPTEDRARYLAALTSGACETVEADALADDCWIAWVATPLTETETAEQRADACERVIGEKDKGECYFVVAETHEAPGFCPKAAPFADDCAMHTVSRGFARARTLDEQGASTQIVLSGLAEDDPRPWSAYYRELLSRAELLDRAPCAAASTPERQAACNATGLALFEDRLNQARDRRLFTCVGAAPQLPWPKRVAWVADPDMDTAFARRTDLCTPLDVPR